ncbi:MAG: ATP-dependent Clp protease ATP-binding subunit [Cyanobacteria bacterium SZAS LIN-2]|nr:ATP-dependent Clp protease ATP-binding subunit [Cyanobacteria bacterium SZAS LIN-2]
MTAMTATLATPATSAKRRRLNPNVVSDTQLAFREFLRDNFFGQPEATALLEKAYANYLNPLRDKTKPIGFLVFAGESRTGKTEGARMIPAFVHKNRFALLKINCSEYMDKHSLWNLKGSPRGHISNQVSTDEKYTNVPKDQKHGYAEFMNHNLEWSKQGSDEPITVVLLDEWDKACYDFNLILLQAMDDGQITLGSGEVVDFRNTLFIAACNSGMEEVEREESGGIGFNARDRKLGHKEVTSVVERVIKGKTPPEFRNRLKELGGIAVFQSLTSEMMKMVVRRDFKALQELITASGYFFGLNVTEAAVDEILRRALLNNGNLSNVKALITSEIQIPLGIEATKRTIKPGDSVTVDVELPEGVVEDAAKPVNKLFFLEVGDPMGTLGGASVGGLGENPVATPGNTASPADAEMTEEDRRMVAALFAVPGSNLLGARSLPMLIMALDGGMQKPSMGFPLADQLNSLGLMPRTPSSFTDLHNLTLLANMSLVKSQVELYPELARGYILEVKQDKSFMTLVDQAREAVYELVTLLGVRILNTRMHHEAPYKFVMEVAAHPQAMMLAHNRFPHLVIRPKVDVTPAE